MLTGSLLYLLGLGVSPFFLFGKNKSTKINQNENLLQSLAVFIMVGILINFSLVLLFKSLAISILICSIISLSGLIVFTFVSIKSQHLKIPSKKTILKFSGAILILFLFFSPIIAEPITDWDARSIWFFHAKMIFTSETLDLSSGWNHPSVSFSHPDYPKLIPVIAGQINYVMGFWNEYLPKASLLLLFIPMILLIFSVGKFSGSFLLLIALIPFSFYNSLWNGYMDGLLALYISISVLFMSKYWRSKRKCDLFTGFICLAIALNIKNEGTLAALAIIISFLLIYGFATPMKSIKRELVRNWKYPLISLVSLLPFFLWNFYKKQWNLSNDLGIGSTQSFINIMNRINDGSYKIIFSRAYEEISGAVMILVILFISILIWKKTIGKEVVFPLLVSGIIAIGIISVYFLTPNELIWHLNTSVDRTMLPVNGGIIIACYYMLKKIES